MRVLISGMTSQQCGSKNRFEYLSVTEQYKLMLEQDGHEVEQRYITPGEDISQWDVAFLGLTPVNALGAQHTYGVLDFISRARENNVGLIFTAEDWRVEQILSGVKTVVRKPERLVKDLYATCRKGYLEWARANLDRLMPVVTAIAERPWPTTLCPMWPWGEHERATKYLPSRNLVPLEFSSVTGLYDVERPNNEDRWGAWICGTLSSRLEWIDGLGLNWPVKYVGGRSSKADMGLKERELAQLYARSWGMMCPPYGHSGSGWWRIRHVHAMQYGAILLSGPRELAAVGDAFRLTGPEIESFTVPQLVEAQMAQREQLQAVSWSREQLRERVDFALRSAYDEAH